MNRPIAAVFLVLGTICFWPNPVQACGETLFRTGAGMRHHADAQQPKGRILVLADASQAQQSYREKLYGGLRRAGHSVTEVADSEALGHALAGGEFDVVLAHQRDIDKVLARIRARGADDDEAGEPPHLIPVLARGSRADALGESFKICLKEGAGVGQALRAIGQALRGAAD
jgi:hypothetical protein